MAEEAAAASGDYNALRARVYNDIINPDYELEIRDTIAARHAWRKGANWVEGLGHVFIVISTVAAFSAGYFSHPLVSYAAGVAGVISISFLRFAAYANKESSERNEVLNRLLRQLGISAVPDLTAGEAGEAGEAGAPARGARRKRKEREGDEN